MLEVEYLMDKSGQPRAVVIPIELWKQLLPQEDSSVEVLSLFPLNQLRNKCAV